MTIKIIGGSGVYSDGKKQHVVTPKDGELHLPPAIEKRFVEQGIAEYTNKKVERKAQKKKADPAPEPKAEPTEEPEVSEETEEEPPTIEAMGAE